MSKSANAGELRTAVSFVNPAVGRETDSEGYPIESKPNVFGDGTKVMVKWVNAHGTEAFTALQLSLRDPATITCRYSDKITQKCLVYRESDPDPYEIISIDNVEQRNVWLEIKVQRKVGAR